MFLGSWNLTDKEKKENNVNINQEGMLVEWITQEMQTCKIQGS